MTGSQYVDQAVTGTGAPGRTRRMLLVDNEMLRYDTMRQACAPMIDSGELVLDWVWRHSDLMDHVNAGESWDIVLVDFDLGRSWLTDPNVATPTHSGLGVMGLLHDRDPDTHFVAITTPFTDPVNQIYLAAASLWFGADSLDVNEIPAEAILDFVRAAEAPIEWTAPIAEAAEILEELLSVPTTRTDAWTDFEWFRALLLAHGEPKAAKEFLAFSGNAYRKWIDQLNAIVRLADQFEDCFGGIVRTREPIPEGAQLMWHNNNGKPAVVFVRDRQRFFIDPDAETQWLSYLRRREQQESE